MDTDASDYGIGGVLSQCIEGTEHVIAYYSKSLNPAQQKYCTTRRELLAVVATLDHFKGYVWGPKFTVRTDHAALVWLKNLKNIQGMLARWLAKLQQFHFDIIHRPGAQHGNADGLSRCPQCDRGACAPNINIDPSDPEQPYASSCIGSSLDSELIPLESGETCMALYESYDEVRAQQQRATHRQKRNYDSKAVARAFPIGCWTLRYYPPARKNKLCSPWIGPYKVVRAPMEWVVGMQLDADARIIYVHMDDLKRCAPPDPEPTWPDAARGTSVVVSTRAPSTLARSDVALSQHTPANTSHHPRVSAHPESVISEQIDLRAPTLPVLRSGAHHPKSTLSGQIDVRAPSSEEIIVKTDTDSNSIVKKYAVPSSAWDLQDENCILSLKSSCSIDVKGYRFFTMERLFYALQLLSLGDRKFIGQLARYSRMDYVKKCVNTRFEMASSTLQDKWLEDQFQTWTQIITARILSDPGFKQAHLDSAGSPLFDPEEPVYATALTSARKLCVQRKITIPTRVTRGQVRV